MGVYRIRKVVINTNATALHAQFLPRTTDLASLLKTAACAQMVRFRLWIRWSNQLTEAADAPELLVLLAYTIAVAVRLVPAAVVDLVVAGSSATRVCVAVRVVRTRLEVPPLLMVK